MTLLIEALVVGLFVSIFGFIISTSIMYISHKNFSITNYPFWKYVVLSYFITGFLFHISCEFTGVNKWYCIQRTADKSG